VSHSSFCRTHPAKWSTSAAKWFTGGGTRFCGTSTASSCHPSGTGAAAPCFRAKGGILHDYQNAQRGSPLATPASHAARAGRARFSMTALHRRCRGRRLGGDRVSSGVLAARRFARDCCHARRRFRGGQATTVPLARGGTGFAAEHAATRQAL
jgi:hypothetical protein